MQASLVKNILRILIVSLTLISIAITFNTYMSAKNFFAEDPTSYSSRIAQEKKSESQKDKEYRDSERLQFYLYLSEVIMISGLGIFTIIIGALHRNYYIIAFGVFFVIFGFYSIFYHVEHCSKKHEIHDQEIKFYRLFTCLGGPG